MARSPHAQITAYAWGAVPAAAAAALLAARYDESELYGLAAVLLVVKGYVAPRLVTPAFEAGEEAHHAWTGPTGTVGALLAGGAAVAGAFFVAAYLMPPGTAYALAGFVGAGALGLLLPTLRHELISHAVGLLLAEEGVSSAGLVLVAASPRLAEGAALLDLVVLALIFGTLLHAVARVHGAMHALRIRRLRG